MGVSWKGEPMGRRLPLFGHHVKTPRPNEVTPEVNVANSFIFGKKAWDVQSGTWARTECHRRPIKKKTSHRTKMTSGNVGPDRVSRGRPIFFLFFFLEKNSNNVTDVLKLKQCHSRPACISPQTMRTSS